MSATFAHLFSPLALRHLRLKNRITFGAHTANMSEDGLPGARHLGYYLARARGGCAMIVVEPVPVHATAVLTRGNFRHQSDDVIAPFRRLTDACHQHGTAMIQQLYHVGAHGDAANSWAANWSPSGAASHHDGDGSHAMTEGEIEAVIDGFVQAARRACLAGFDGVELFAAYNALIDQFWSPLSNRRTDRWGDALENRVRFAVQIIEGIRKEAGLDFVIGMAISGAEPYPGGLSLADKAEICAWLDQRGLVDYFTVGTGSYLNHFERIVPSFLTDPLLGAEDAAAIRRAVRYARVQAEARIRTPANGDQLIASGQADLVSLVRAQIADPDLAHKAMAGRAADIRPCINCNQECIGRRLRDYWISCLVNPSAGREFAWAETEGSRAERPKRVLVVGGGPAGMEAARVAAGRGHRVTLIERTEGLGGQLRLAARQPKREEIGEFLAWLERQLTQLQVEIRRRTELSADDIAADEYDAVVIATGARPGGTGFQRALPHVAQLPGVNLEHVVSVEDVLSGSVTPGQRVLLVDDDGGWRACGTALHLAERGHRVTVLTPALHVGHHLGHTASLGLLAKALAERDVAVVTSAALRAIEREEVVILDLLTGHERREPFDAVVLATLPEANAELAGELGARGIAATAIGDCIAPRKATMALYEARRLALEL
jgi:2,4-dienoyl-CoA reductase-like NADH-dependent reductase (Old Yellow Enzyme family)/thioredoxin reductase